MANRYWVGGTGAWSDVSTANWSTATGLSFTATCTGTALTTTGSPALVAGMTVWSSAHVSLGTIVSGAVNTWVVSVGGTYASQSMSAATVGASVPTAADSVFFDANSNSGTTAFTVTMSVTPRLCNDFTASGLDGTMTLAGSAIGLTVSGSLTFQATNFTITYNGATTFNATTTGKTVTTNGVAFGANVDFNGVGGGWTLGSALSSVTVVVTSGTFSTSSSGNYAVTATAFSSSVATARTINLNASTLTLSSNSNAWNMATSTSATLNAGTSTINITSASGPVFNGGGLTYYNVAYTSGGLTSAATITGTNTFTNLSLASRTSLGISQYNFGANQTISGTLTISAGTAAAYRTMIASDTVATSRTLTVATVASLTDIDFRDIVAAGASGTWSGTRLGNCKGNSNITFPAAKTVYYGQTGSNNWGGAGSGSWSATSGGALDATQFPLAQDTAVFPAATYPASGSTTTINGNYNIGTIDMSLRTSNTMTLANTSSNPVIYGNWINGTGITLSSVNNIYFSGRTTQTITSAGRTFTQAIFIDSPSGSVALQDALTTTATATIVLTTGTLNLNNFTLSIGLFSSSNTNTRTIAFGTGQISCTGTGTVWSTSTASNLTTTGTQVVNVTSTGSTLITVAPGALSQANSISFNFTGGIYALTFLSGTSHTARNVDFTGYAGTLGATGVNATIYGNLKFSTGMTLTASTNAMLFGATSGTQQITTNTKTIDFPLNFNGVGGTFQLQDALTMGSTRTCFLTAGTLNLNGQTLTVGLTLQTVAGTKNLTFNGGTLVCPTASTTAFYNVVPAGFTTTAGTGTGTISMTAATAKTFVGGGSTFNCTLQNAGAGALTITGSNTFTSISNSVQPTTFTFTAATTTTVTNWNVNGTAGNLVTIGSATAASHTLSKSSGTVNSNYLSISRSTATGGATWNAINSTDGGNNSGWNFITSASSGNFLMLLRYR